MENIGSYLLASAYTGVLPLANTVSAVCSVNGESVPCPDGITGIFFATFAVFWIVWLVLVILMIVSLWKILTKAGRPGWASLIPVYNYVVILEMIGKPIWWIVFMFIPFANIIVSIIILHNISKVFGKDVGFTVGLFFLPFIFYPVLAFGKSVYINPAGSSNVPPVQPQATV